MSNPTNSNSNNSMNNHNQNHSHSHDHGHNPNNSISGAVEAFVALTVCLMAIFAVALSFVPGPAPLNAHRNLAWYEVPNSGAFPFNGPNFTVGSVQSLEKEILAQH
jgi:hypothetical protein